MPGTGSGTTHRSEKFTTDEVIRAVRRFAVRASGETSEEMEAHFDDALGTRDALLLEMGGVPGEAGKKLGYLCIGMMLARDIEAARDR